jgi:ADP-heptose:LPS heptosyltransferase
MKLFLAVRNLFKFINLLIISFLIKRDKVETKPKTLLIVRLDSIGDYIMFRNFLSVLKEDDRFKDYKITLCGNIVWKNLAETLDSNIIDDFIWIDRKKFLQKISYKYETLKAIYNRGFEIAVDTIHSREILFGDIIIKVSRAHERIGSRITEKYSKIKKNIFSDSFYTKLIPVSKSVLFEFERNKEFFKNFLQKDITIEKPFINTEQIELSNKIKNKYVVLFPGASRKSKMWDTTKFKEIADYLISAYSFNVALSGSVNENYLFNEIVFENKKDNFFNYFGISLPMLARLIADSELLVSNDTSAVHFAAAVDTPFICITDGFYYGRFYPYPKNIFDKAYYAYPGESGKKFNAEAASTRLLDVNSVPVGKVKNILEEIFKN